jgi:CRP-like cAMP-binding protein
MARTAPVIPVRTLRETGSPYDPLALVCTECSVRRFALFGALDDIGLENLHHQITSISLEPGQPLYSAEGEGLALFTVRSGVLRLERSSQAGERRILRLAGRTDLVGLEALLGQTYAADAVACTDVEACRIPRVLIDELLPGHLDVALDLMKRWQRALDDSEEWLTELTRGTARRRMLRLLLKLSEYGEPDGMVWLPTRQEMGAMLALTFETASRVVSMLRKEQILTPVDARRTQVNMTGLLKALNEDTDAER